MSFTQRLISVQLSLANGSFGSGGNSMTIEGLRCSMRIQVPGGMTKSNLDGVIYGLSLSDMNQLSTVGTQMSKMYKNTITVMAGDEQSGMALVYQGTLTSAYVDAAAMPNVGLRVRGQAGAYEAVAPIQPTAMQGQGDVATMMGNLAQQMGLQFENNGVQVQLSNPYYYGSAYFQVEQMARHAGIEFLVDRGTLAIWNPSQARQGGAVMVAPDTGMVGYPLFNQQNVIVTTIFDPTIRYGGQMQIQSDLTPACGLWNINNLNLELDSIIPHGKWFATMSGVQANAQQIDP